MKSIVNTNACSEPARKPSGSEVAACKVMHDTTDHPATSTETDKAPTIKRRLVPGALDKAFAISLLGAE